MPTAPESEPEVLESASTVDAQAMDFIIRRDLGNWNAGERAEFESWISKSFAHRAAYWRLNSVWSRADRLNALRPSAPQTVRANIASRKAAFLKVAAAVVVLAGVAGGANHFLPVSQTKIYQTSVGGRENIVLADGSRVELNTDTILRADVGGKYRSVELVRGEALFHVKHDAEHPFVVTAAQHRIVDLGTSFVVREKKDRVEVALLEGRARLESTDANAPTKRIAILTPGDEAVATQQQISVTRKPAAEIEDKLGWQRGVLVFRSSTLAQVAAEYNRYNERKIVIADETAAARTMSATLPTTDPEMFARVARNFLGLQVRETKDEIVISH